MAGLSPRTGHGFTPPTPERYIISAAILVAGVLAQYFPIFPPIPYAWEAELLGALVTYGPGLLAFFVLIGIRPLRNAFSRNVPGALEGLRWYGIFGVLSLALVILLAAFYLTFDPRYSHLVDQNTPVDQEGASAPWAWILISYPIGLIEETLFRGFLFGGALLVYGTRRWKWHALWTSTLFAGVHVYYAQTYLEVSLLDYVQIFLLGLAFSYAYFRSGGNLLVIALLHGTFDATSFASFIPGVGATGSLDLKLGLLGIAGLVALTLFMRENRETAAVGPVGAAGSGAPPASPGTGTSAMGFGGPPPAIRAPEATLAWAMTSPDSTPPAIPVTPPTTPPPSPSPPPTLAGPPPRLPSVPLGPAVPSAPGSRASFVPPLCPGCGAIVMGDLRGIPESCPRCHAPLGAAATITLAGQWRTVPLAASGVPHPVVAAVERPTPACAPAGAEGGDPKERMEPGTWPPGVTGADPFHSAATLYLHPPEPPKTGGGGGRI